jgi:thioesterase domain-containing protein
MQRIWAMLLEAQSTYRPKSTDPGPLLLFVAEHPFRWPATRMDDPTKGWRRWIKGRIDLFTVKGSHLELFRSDNIERMAGAINALVDELTKKSAPKPLARNDVDVRAANDNVAAAE